MGFNSKQSAWGMAAVLALLATACQQQTALRGKTTGPSSGKDALDTKTGGKASPGENDANSKGHNGPGIPGSEYPPTWVPTEPDPSIFGSGAGGGTVTGSVSGGSGGASGGGSSGKTGSTTAGTSGSGSGSGSGASGSSSGSGSGSGLGSGGSGSSSGSGSGSGVGSGGSGSSSGSGSGSGTASKSTSGTNGGSGAGLGTGIAGGGSAGSGTTAARNPWEEFLKTYPGSSSTSSGGSGSGGKTTAGTGTGGSSGGGSYGGSTSSTGGSGSSGGSTSYPGGTTSGGSGSTGSQPGSSTTTGGGTTGGTGTGGSSSKTPGGEVIVGYPNTTTTTGGGSGSGSPGTTSKTTTGGGNVPGVPSTTTSTTSGGRPPLDPAKPLRLTVVQRKYEAWWRNCMSVGVFDGNTLIDSAFVGCNKDVDLVGKMIDLRAKPWPACNKVRVFIKTYKNQGDDCSRNQFKVPNFVCMGPYLTTPDWSRTSANPEHAPFFKVYDARNATKKDPKIDFDIDAAKLEQYARTFRGDGKNRWIIGFYEDQPTLSGPGIDYNDYVFDLQGQGVKFTVDGSSVTCDSQ